VAGAYTWSHRACNEKTWAGEAFSASVGRGNNVLCTFSLTHTQASPILLPPAPESPRRGTTRVGAARSPAGAVGVSDPWTAGRSASTAGICTARAGTTGLETHQSPLGAGCTRCCATPVDDRVMARVEGGVCPVAVAVAIAVAVAGAGGRVNVPGTRDLAGVTTPPSVTSTLMVGAPAA
jgi:hypothetical protein